MIHDPRWWSSVPEALHGLCGVVARVRVMLASLRLAPDDVETRAEVVRLAGSMVGHADRENWHALGDVAGPLVRLLSTRRGGEPELTALELGFEAVERLIAERLART